MSSTCCKMTKWLTAAMLLTLVEEVFSARHLPCNHSEYQIAGRCCPRCPPGYRVHLNCTIVKTTACVPCPEGSFMDLSSGNTYCFHCATCDTGSGLKVKSSCTVTSDTTCEPLEGFYCIDSTGVSCISAQKHRSCLPGQYISQKGTAFTDTECSDYIDGTASANAEREEQSSPWTAQHILSFALLSFILVLIVIGFVCQYILRKPRVNQKYVNLGIVMSE